MGRSTCSPRFSAIGSPSFACEFRGTQVVTDRLRPAVELGPSWTFQSLGGILEHVAVVYFKAMEIVRTVMEVARTAVTVCRAGMDTAGARKPPAFSEVANVASRLFGEPGHCGLPLRSCRSVLADIQATAAPSQKSPFKTAQSLEVALCSMAGVVRNPTTCAFDTLSNGRYR